MNTERWLPVVGYEGLYEVSDLGRVRSLPRETVSGMRGGKILKPSRNSTNQKYLKVVVSDQERAQFLVHRLVLEAFVGPCPEGMEACHFPDRDPTNNRLNNLRWDTPIKNCSDKVVHGTHNKGALHGMAKLTDASVIQIRDLWFSGFSHSQIARHMAVSRSAISMILAGKRWGHVGAAT